MKKTYKELRDILNTLSLKDLNREIIIVSENGVLNVLDIEMFVPDFGRDDYFEQGQILLHI